MSFSSLPPELVHQIIESTVPHAYHSDTYHGRKHTLRCLSLVSKLFRSIAQPLLFEIVQLDPSRNTIEPAENLAAAGSSRVQRSVRWLVLDWSWGHEQDLTQEEVDQFLGSLRVFETAPNLTLSYLEERIVSRFISISSSHLTYLHLSSSDFESSSTISLPLLHSLTLNDVSFELFRSLVDPSTAPNLRNLALVDSSEEIMQWIKEPSISRFLLQLETLHLEAAAWRELEASFRRSAASRTLVNITQYRFETAYSLEVSVVHARFERLFFHPLFSDEAVAKKLNLCAAIVKDSPTLKSLFLDSSFRYPSQLPPLIRSSVENLARIAQERKIDLVFERVPIDRELDPVISGEFIRRQKSSRDHQAGRDGVKR